jgi:hypothetical protein
MENALLCSIIVIGTKDFLEIVNAVDDFLLLLL